MPSEPNTTDSDKGDWSSEIGKHWNNTVEVSKDLAKNTGEFINTGIDTIIDTKNRIIKARADYKVATDETQSIATRCNASRKVKEHQRNLGSVQRAIKEFENPVIAFSQKDRDGNIVEVKTGYWGDGYVAGAGFGFDIIPYDSNNAPLQKMWVDVNYANLIEKVNGVNVDDLGETSQTNGCIPIDDLIKIVEYLKGVQYKIPAKYSKSNKDINIRRLTDGGYEITSNLAGGKKRKRKTKKNRKSKNKRYSLKKFLTRK
jgi:hypothetical protein